MRAPVVPLYSAVLSITAILIEIMKKAVPVAALHVVFVPLMAAALFIFFDNIMRAAAALIALDERVRVRI